MANTKEIKGRIKAVQNTQKVTRSMKLLSTIKLQQSIKFLNNSKLFTEQLLTLLRRVSTQIAEISNRELRDLFTVEQTADTVYLVVISSDKGLCGGYNNNVFKGIKAQIADIESQNKKVKLYPVGKKATHFCKKFLEQYDVESSLDNNQFEDSDICNNLYRISLDKSVSAIRVLYTHFVSSMTFNVNTFDLYPLKTQELFNLEANKTEHQVNQDELILEPSPEELLTELIPLYYRDRLNEAVNHSRASEMANRVTAMTAATDNASNLIQELTLKFNKARQAAITQEISEIVVGVESMK